MNIEILAKIKSLLLKMKVQEIHEIIDCQIKDELFKMYLSGELTVRPVKVELAKENDLKESDPVENKEPPSEPEVIEAEDATEEFNDMRIRQDSCLQKECHVTPQTESSPLPSIVKRHEPESKFSKVIEASSAASEKQLMEQEETKQAMSERRAKEMLEFERVDMDKVSVSIKKASKGKDVCLLAREIKVSLATLGKLKANKPGIKYSENTILKLIVFFGGEIFSDARPGRKKMRKYPRLGDL